MRSTPTKSRTQFSLRSLLGGLTWFALILAICVNHQHAAAKYRQTLNTLKAAGALPAARLLGPRQPPPARPRPADSLPSRSP